MNSLIQRLMYDFEKIKNENTLKRYSNGTYEQKIDYCIEDRFKHSIEATRKRNPNSLKYLYLHGEILRKRKKAIRNTLPEFVKKYQDIYKDISIEYEYIEFNSLPSFINYDVINDCNYIFEAAALSILYDALNRGHIDELLKLLPSDENTIDTAIVHPDANDLIFSHNVIHSLVAVIQEFFEFNIKDDEQYIFTKNYVSKDVSARKNYELLKKIFSLIDENKLKTAVDDFKNDIYKVTDFVFETANYYQKQIKDIIKKQEYLISEIISIEANDSTVFANDITASMKLKQLTYIDDFSNFVERQVAIDDKKQTLKLAIDFLYENNSLLDNDVDDFIADKVRKLEIDNPFETSLAFIYLLFVKDDFIWLLIPCKTVLKLAGEKLPWTKDINFARDNNEKEVEIAEAKSNEFDNLTAEDIRKDEIEFSNKQRLFNKELYKQKYNDSWRWYDPANANDGEIIAWNLPQMIFDYTSCIMPLDLFSITDKNENSLELSGFKNEEVELLELLMCTYGEIGINIDFKNSNIADSEETINEIDIDSVKESLKKKKEELLKTKYSLNESRKNVSHLEKESEKLKKENDSLKDEITQLRNLIFNLQSNSFDDELSIPQNVGLPYTPLKKTVVIGGTDTWINKFKDKLNDVVFISSKTKINQDLLKTAEVIWIQTIALKHSDFYAISAYKEKRNIILNYFSYSNIDKCLKQLTDYDLKNSRKL